MHYYYAEPASNFVKQSIILCFLQYGQQTKESVLRDDIETSLSFSLLLTSKIMQTLKQSYISVSVNISEHILFI